MRKIIMNLLSLAVFAGSLNLQQVKAENAEEGLNGSETFIETAAQVSPEHLPVSEYKPEVPEVFPDEEAYVYAEDTRSEINADNEQANLNDSYGNNEKPEEGYAYAVLEDDGDLIFFRSENEYSGKTTGTFTDLDGNSYTGIVYADPESDTSYAGPSWHENADQILSVKTAEGQHIYPITMDFWFDECSKAEKIDLSGFDTSDTVGMRAAFRGCSSLSTLDVTCLNTSKVTNMANMFYGCNSLNALDLGEFDTSCVTDMVGMFTNCSSLQTLDLGSFDTSKLENMNSMFSSCSGLSELNLESMTTESVKNMSWLFYGCENLKTLDLSGFDTSEVTNMRFMFYNCKSLTNVDLSNFDTRNVTDFSYMFCNCVNLENLECGNFSTPSATMMNSMFSGCQKLTSLDLSGFETEKVSNMAFMFCDCQNITELDVSDFDTSEVTSMFCMFMLCKNLVSLDVSNFNTSKVKDIDGMFSSCQKLTKIDVSGFDTSCAERMGSMFSGCNELTELDVSNFDTSKSTTFFNMFSSCSKLETIDVSNFDTSNAESIGYMFYGCDSLSEIDVSNFDTSKVTDMRFVFAGYSGSAPLEISGFDTANVTNMRGMFYGCSELSEIDVSHFDTSKVTDMGYMFRGCNNLKTLDVSGFDTSNVTTMDDMFFGCSSLEKLDVSGFDTSKVTDLYQTFRGCSGLSELDVSHFNTSNVTDMQGLFANCSGLKTLDVSHFDTSNVTTMGGMFYVCSSLESVDVSHFDTLGVTGLEWMFGGCSSLKELDVSSFDTSDAVYFQGMFSNCSNLSELDVSGFATPEATDMYGMFYNCTQIKELDLNGFDTSKVTGMESLFANMNSLKEIVLGSGFVNWLDNAYLPTGTWTNGNIYKSEMELYNEYPSNASEWAGRWYCVVPVTGITVSPERITISVYESTALSAQVIPEDADNQKIVWSSSDSSVAEVDENGLVTAVAAGTAVITAVTEEGNHSDTCEVTVLAHVHSGSNSSYTWSEDFSTVTAKALCTVCGEEVTETVNTTYEVIKEPTCEEKGTGRYTAEFINELFTTQTKDVEIEAVGHDYKLSTWEWSEDYSSAQAVFGCENDESHTEKVTATVTSVRTEPTCAAEGSIVYTATVTFEGSTYTDTKSVVLEKIDHVYGESVYTWAADFSTVTAKAVCTVCSDEVTETVNTSYEVIKAATAEEDGTGRYTAVFTNEMFETQTKDITLPATGHTYGTPEYTWSEDNKTVTAVVKCTDCDREITETVDTVYEVIKAPGCEEKGTGRYSAYFANELFTTQTKDVEIDAIGHNYGEPEYTWAVDFKTVTAKAACENCGDEITETVETTYEVIKEATLEETGTGKYTAVFTNEMFETQTKEVEIPALSDKSPKEIHLDHHELSILCNASVRLSAQVLPEDAEDKSVTWTSSDESVAIVGANGTVSGMKPGKATITATTVNGLTDTCEVRVLFTDVAVSSQYFYTPVYWAVDNGITVGAGGPGKFSPSASCTREQFVTFLWRMEGEPEPEEGCTFSDVPESAWYYKSISWAAEKGITTGLNDGTGRFGVGEACTREQCVTFLHRAAGSPEPEGSIEFTDSQEGRYYYKAIKWAAGKGITVGLNDGTGRFGVGQKCTRGMLVTFLYRYAHAN